MKVIFCVGLPASGKSTWAKAKAARDGNWVRVCRDDLRHMRGRYWLPKHEGFITELEDGAIFAALNRGYNVIIDAMNLNDEFRKAKTKQILKLYPTATIEYKRFDITLEESIKRDLVRPNSLGSKVIREIYKRHFPDPVVSEIVYTEDKELPQCYIFDIDGTLADRGSRSPYDWAKVGNDTLRADVRDLLFMAYDAGHQIILFSGRDRVCEGETIEWLNKFKIPFNALYMRPEGNNQKDSIIKKEMFERNIRGRYYCMGVFDDRDQVVEMWRKELGVPCYQVNYGDF